MMLLVNLSRAAQQEFDEAADWYNLKSDGRGRLFTLAVRALLDRISEKPTLYPTVFLATVRQAIVPKYPYSILYQIRPNDISVISVFHASRDPEVWQRRV